MQIVETSAWIHQIGWSLIHSLWQDALIALMLAAILKLLFRAKAQSRYFIACLALAAMLILPVVTTYVLHVRQTEPLDMVIDDDSAAVMSVDSNFPNTGLIENERIVGTQKINWVKSTAATWNLSERIEKFLPWLILSWLVGVSIYAIKLGGGLFYAANLRKLSENTFNQKLDDLVNELTARLSIKRKIKICESSLINVPMTIGWIYPLILIPPSALLGLTPFQLQTIITHELIHIKRCDFLINFLQSVAETLLFYHPAARWASRKIREEREYICDDLTAAFCKDSTAYARALTKIAKFQRQAEQLAVAATSGGELKDRIYRLVPNSQNPGFSKKSILPNVWAVIVISLFPIIIFGGLKVLSDNNEADLNKTSVASVPEAYKSGAENSSLTGEYNDDVSKENARFREVALQALKGHRGSVIVMNPRTGQVYTIVNQDWAFRRELSAGSTFKMITSLAGIEENQLKESSKGFGYNSSMQTNLAKALAVYNNDYFKSLGQNLGSDTLIKYSKQFGLGEKTGINYPDETAGYVPEEMNHDSSELAGVTGGDIQITPLQLAVFVSAVYNGGKILIPQAANGNDSVTTQERGNLSISESSVEELKKGLQAAVEIGTGKGARQENYKVSGKTASVSNKDGAIGLFASYGINNNSEMVVVVALDGKNEKGAIAAQIAGKIYNSI